MEVQKYLEKLEHEIQNITEETERAIQAERLEDALAEYKGDDRVISTTEIMKNIKAGELLPTHQTGFNELDVLLGGGFRPKQVITISAATKSGKTAFCMDLACNMKELNPLWLSFEETIEELLEKFIDRNEEPPMFYAPKNMKGTTISWIEERIVESKVKYDTQLVFIDHLHFIVPFTSRRLDTEIGQVMRELKRIAKQWGVTVVLVAHLTKTSMDIPPTLADIRDSSFQAQESDTVLMLWRQAVKDDDGQIQITNNTNLSVQAVRHGKGKPGNVKLTFQDGHFKQSEWNFVPRNEGEW